MLGRVLSLCDYSGIAVEPWAEAGYPCTLVDLRHELPGMRVEIIQADVRRWCPPSGPIALVMAWPPCTDLAVSGARWFAGKGLDALADAISVVAACVRIAEASGAPYLIENPVSTLSTYWRKPDYTFNPCDFAGYLEDPREDAYTKRTCLWVGGGFVMPRARPIGPVLGSKMHLLSPTPDRAELRSATPLGFARAVFEANSRPLEMQEAACR